MGFLYKSFYSLLKYFHSWLWADLEDGIPSRPVAVIKNDELSDKIHQGVRKRMLHDKNFLQLGKQLGITIPEAY